MKKRKAKTAKKLNLGRITVRSLNEMGPITGGRTDVSLGNTRCSVTDGFADFVCIETL